MINIYVDNICSLPNLSSDPPNTTFYKPDLDYSNPVSQLSLPTLSHQSPQPDHYDTLVQRMSLWQSFRNLTPRTRLYFGLGAIAWSGVGLLLTDKAEETFGLKPTEEDKKELEVMVPRIRRVE